MNTIVLIYMKNFFQTEKFRNIQSLLKIIEIHCRIKEPPQPQDISFLTSMGFERQKVLCALRIMKNNIPGALEWLCGDREAALLQIKEGLSIDTEIVKFLLSRTKYLLLLSSPTMFMGKQNHKKNLSNKKTYKFDSFPKYIGQKHDCEAVEFQRRSLQKHRFFN